MGIFGKWWGKTVDAVRNKDGSYAYWFKETPFGSDVNGLEWSLSNPVLQTVIALRCKLYSQMKITAVNANGDDVTIPELALLSKPNYFQSQQDFLFQQMWFLSATGNNLVHQVKPFEKEGPKALFNLIPSTIDWKDVNKVRKFLTQKEDIEAFENQTIGYKLDNQDYNLKLSTLIPLYDLANGIGQNQFMQSPSRVSGIKGVLHNIDENLRSKNINLKMSQKYIGRNASPPDGQPQILDTDRDDIYKKLGRNDLSITNANIEIQHLVKDFKNLLLDPMFESDAIKVLLAFDMNRDTINYSNTGSKYDNNEQGLVNVIQNSIQGSADNTMNSLTNSWGLDLKGIRLKASYNHLPIMQTTLKAKITIFSEYQTGLKAAIENKTITPAEAKVMSDNLKKELGL